MAPGFAAMASAAEQLWLPGMAQAKIKPTSVTKIKPTSVSADDFSTAISQAHVGPIGGAVGCKDYKEFEKVIYGVIEGIKTGECPPQFKNASRAFLLKEEGGNRVMLTLLIPTADVKAGLPFFLESGPKANPMWADFNATWKDADVPIFATASEAFLVRGEANAQKSVKGKWFGQYQLGWNGTTDEWIPEFTNPQVRRSCTGRFIIVNLPTARLLLTFKERASECLCGLHRVRDTQKIVPKLGVLST